MKLTRGERNNNPGNIRFDARNQWVGLCGSDGTFCKFDTMRNGVRALMKLIRNYYLKYNLRTIRDIVGRFAPPNENHTDIYIKFVVEKVGIDADSRIGFHDKGTWVKLAQAIMLYESKVDIDIATLSSIYDYIW